MKRNLRKMDEPPGKHPLFIPLVLQMITNALSPPFSPCAHTRRSGAGRREELPIGVRLIDRGSVCLCLSVWQIREGEKVAEGHTTKRPDWPEHSAQILGERRRPFWRGMTTRQRIYPPSTLSLHWKFCASSAVKRTVWFHICTESKRERDNAETRRPRDGVFNRFADRDPSAQTGTPALHWLPYVHALQTPGYSTSFIPLPSVFWHPSTRAFGFFCGTAH